MFDVVKQINPRMVARANMLNPKSFPVGSVVYFLKNKKGSSEKMIDFGTVIDHYCSEIAIQLYEPIDCRFIDDIPVRNFCTPSPWQKLPKGWSWDTKLFEIQFKFADEMKDRVFNIKDKCNIMDLINDNLLVKPSENDHANFRSEVDSKYGWRIVREYDNEWHSDYVSLPFYEVYGTYEEAQAELDAILEENQRQAALTDLEWSIEQIDNNLDKWAFLYSIAPEAKKQVRDRLMALDNLEDVETRVAGGYIEWKYDKNRRWLRIEM